MAGEKKGEVPILVVLALLLVVAAFVWNSAEIYFMKRDLKNARERSDLMFVWITGVEKLMIKEGLDPPPIPQKLYELGD